jgi:hypothetical protein
MASDRFETAPAPDVARPGLLVAVAGLAFVIGVTETLTWLGARGVMALGGFVASGGPYVIAHQAPGWVWVLPVSMILLVVAMMTSKGLSDSRDTPSLMLVAWSCLFLTIGVAFLEFGLGLHGGGLSIGWLVCAVSFFAMGGGGVYALTQSRQARRELDAQKVQRSGVQPIRSGFRAYQVASAVALLLGVAAGWGVFTLLGA